MKLKMANSTTMWLHARPHHHQQQHYVPRTNIPPTKKSIFDSSEVKTLQFWQKTSEPNGMRNESRFGLLLKANRTVRSLDWCCGQLCIFLANWNLQRLAFIRPNQYSNEWWIVLSKKAKKKLFSCLPFFWGSWFANFREILQLFLRLTTTYVEHKLNSTFHDAY